MAPTELAIKNIADVIIVAIFLALVFSFFYKTVLKTASFISPTASLTAITTKIQEAWDEGGAVLKIPKKQNYLPENYYIMQFFVQEQEANLTNNALGGEDIWTTVKEMKDCIGQTCLCSVYIHHCANRECARIDGLRAKTCTRDRQQTDEGFDALPDKCCVKPRQRLENLFYSQYPEVSKKGIFNGIITTNEQAEKDMTITAIGTAYETILKTFTTNFLGSAECPDNYYILKCEHVGKENENIYFTINGKVIIAFPYKEKPAELITLEKKGETVDIKEYRVLTYG